MAVACGGCIRRKSKDWPGGTSVTYAGADLVYCSDDGAKVYVGVYRPTIEDILANDWEHHKTKKRGIKK